MKRGGDFVLYDDVWAPTGVMLGKATYPQRDAVMAAIEAAGARLIVFLPDLIPTIGGRAAAANLVVLGAACATPTLARLLDADSVEKSVAKRWPAVSSRNVEAFRVGLDLSRKTQLGSSCRHELLTDAADGSASSRIGRQVGGSR